MLRWLLALVVVANLLFLAWSQHWLAPLGLAPLPTGEPQRLERQLHPEAVTFRPDTPVAAAREAQAQATEDAASAAAAESPASAASAAFISASAPASAASTTTRP